MKNMTALEVYSVCTKNDYVLFRASESGVIWAFNCKCVYAAMRHKFHSMHSQTRFISYRKCSFMDYISNKGIYYFKG